MGACPSRLSLQASIANVVAHADDAAIKLAVLHLLRTYAASTATDLDDALVDVVERALFPRSPDSDSRDSLDD